jgi:hypothetical protein
MADYNTDRRGGAGKTIAIIAAVALLIVAVLFMTGFFSAKVTKDGSLPDVDISAKGGELPAVDVDSKKVVVGTKETTVDVPKVTTEKESVDVPVVGVSDGKKD